MWLYYKDKNNIGLFTWIAVRPKVLTAFTSTPSASSALTFIMSPAAAAVVRASTPGATAVCPKLKDQLLLSKLSGVGASHEGSVGEVVLNWVVWATPVSCLASRPDSKGSQEMGTAAATVLAPQGLWRTLRTAADWWLWTAASLLASSVRHWKGSCMLVITRQSPPSLPPCSRECRFLSRVRHRLGGGGVMRFLMAWSLGFEMEGNPLLGLKDKSGGMVQGCSRGDASFVAVFVLPWVIEGSGVGEKLILLSWGGLPTFEPSGKYTGVGVLSLWSLDSSFPGSARLFRFSLLGPLLFLRCLVEVPADLGGENTGSEDLTWDSTWNTPLGNSSPLGSWLTGWKYCVYWLEILATLTSLFLGSRSFSYCSAKSCWDMMVDPVFLGLPAGDPVFFGEPFAGAVFLGDPFFSAEISSSSALPDWCQLLWWDRVLGSLWGERLLLRVLSSGVVLCVNGWTEEDLCGKE